MSIGASSSLSSMLARLNSIEGNFNALESVTFELKNTQTQKIQDSAQDYSFKKILDGKIQQTQTSEESKAEEISNNPQQQAQKAIEEVIESEKEEAGEKKEVTEAIKLKSKIDTKAQSSNIDEIIETFSNKYNIDGDFIKAIIKQESGFNPKATSKKGAMGLMQLMPATAKSLGVEDAYNPLQNIEGGVKHLKGLLSRYDNNEELALAAYNAGAGAVKKYGGIPPYKETQNYVKSIMSIYNKIKEAKI